MLDVRSVLLLSVMVLICSALSFPKLTVRILGLPKEQQGHLFVEHSVVRICETQYLSL